MADMTYMSYVAIKHLMEDIEEARASSRTPEELSALEFAERMVVHGREFLDIGDHRAAWLRLSGAVTFLERAGWPEVARARVHLSELLATD